VDVLDEERLSATLADAAQAIEYGMAPQVSVREFIIGDALERLRREMDDAARIAGIETLRPRDVADSDPAQQLAELRRQLSGAMPGPQPAPDDQGDGADGRGGGAGSDRAGPGGWAWWGDRRPVPLSDRLDVATATENAREIVRLMMAMSEELAERGVSDEQIARAQQVARQLASGDSDAVRIAEEVRSLISQIESMELTLSAATERGPAARPLPREDAVEEDSAEYFRRLSSPDVR
jgi:hypothetical protein